MTGKKLKFVGVCGAALIMFSTVTPASALLFGNTVTAQAATVEGTFLENSVNFDQDSFVQQDLLDLRKTNLNKGDTTSRIYKALFPTAENNGATTVLAALGYPASNTDYDDYYVEISSDISSDISTIDDLKNFDGTLNVTFTVRNGSDALVKEFKSALVVKGFSVKESNLIKSMGDAYSVSEGIEVFNADGSKANEVAAITTTPGDYTVTDITQTGATVTTALSELTDNATTPKYNTTTDGFTQRLSIKYVTATGTVKERIVTRVITVSENAAYKPMLQANNNVGTTIGTYFTDGETVSDSFGYTTQAESVAPPQGTLEWLKTKVYDSASQLIRVNTNVNTAVTQLAIKASVNGQISALATKDAVVIEAGNVNPTVPGDYTYTVKVTNEKGLTSTFKVPFTVTAADNMPYIEYSLGYSDTMTIPMNEAFDPYEGVKFYENQEGTKVPISASNVKMTSNVNTAVAGTYAVNYVVTNSSGNTSTFTRKVIVSDQAIPTMTVYRAYNPNNGDHIYVTTQTEYATIVAAGWQGEGVAFQAATTGSPVYRLYNPNTGEHFFTSGLGEYNNLQSVGWNGEGVAFYSTNAEDGVAIYRLFNPYSPGPGTHLFTPGAGERDNLVSLGWNDEGVGFYAVSLR